MATKYYLYYVEGEDEKLQRKQRCLTDLIESGFLICETGDDVCLLYTSDAADEL